MKMCYVTFYHETVNATLVLLVPDNMSLQQKDQPMVLARIIQAG